MGYDFDIMPMLAADGGTLFDDEAYAYEPKWDGYRAIVFVSDEVRVQSRNLKQITEQFPELKRVRDALRTNLGVVLDGEIVCMVDGKPDFHALRRHSQAVTFVAFDILYDGQTCLMQLPLLERKALLKARVIDCDAVTKNLWVKGKGSTLYNAACRAGMEGVVAKHLESPYLPGRRSRYWLKFKRRRTVDCVVGGLTYGPTGHLASVAVGLYEHEHLRYVGNVGSGLTASNAAELAEQTTPSSDSPFDLSLSAMPREVIGRTRWVKPELCCEVSYAEFTPELKLRQPVIIRIRNDKDPRECEL